MLVPYESLLSLDSDTFNRLVKEYLLAQVEDGSFIDLDEQQVERATLQCKQALKKGDLVVEYSEDDESIAIRQRDQLSRPTSTYNE